MLFCHHEKQYAKQNENKDNIKGDKKFTTKVYFFHFEDSPFLIMTTDKTEDPSWTLEDPVDENKVGLEKKNYYWRIE